MTDITPTDWESRQSHGRCSRGSRAPRRSHPKRTVFGGLLRLHRDLVPGVRPAQGHAREQVRDPGLGCAEGDRRPQGQVRRAQRRHPAGRLQRADERQAGHARAARPRSAPRSPKAGKASSTRPTSAARSPTTTSASRRRTRASATPRCSSRRTASSSRAARSSTSRTRCGRRSRQGRHPDGVHR